MNSFSECAASKIECLDFVTRTLTSLYDGQLLKLNESINFLEREIRSIRKQTKRSKERVQELHERLAKVENHLNNPTDPTRIAALIKSVEADMIGSRKSIKIPWPIITKLSII